MGAVVHPMVLGVPGSSDVHPFKGGVYITPKGVRLAADRLLVRFRAEVSPAARANARASVGASLVRSFRLVPRLELMKTSAGASAVEVAARLSRDPGVQYALPDILVPLEQLPNDALYAQLWGMTSIGAPAAWGRSTGNATVKVGVLDTGVATTHPDLSANVWTNPGEIAGNGIDDDANGYIDDVHGWDFENGDNDPADAHGHGTHVSGTIGAVGNNGVGVAGVNWSVSLVPLKICSDFCSLAAEIAALQYAADEGVKVVNASFGSARSPSTPEQDAIAAAGAAGILYVAAAGNSSSDNDSTPVYPAGYALDNVLAVAALEPGESLASFSNYGSGTVHLAAPGQGILSTLPGGAYGTLDGTSMAAPHVAGAAALLWSLHPGWTPQQIRTRLLRSTRLSSSLAGKVSTCGLLDVGAATDPAFSDSARLCVARTGTGAGTVSSTPAGIDCGSACAAAFAPGTPVTLTASPAAGSTFAGWRGACSGTGTCSVTVATGASAIATFRRPGTPAFWTEAVLEPPAARAPVLPKTVTPGSFFNVSLSADGATRAKTIYNLREDIGGGAAQCFYDTTDTGGVYLERKTPAGWVADGALAAPAVGTDGYARWANCGGFGSVTELSGDGSTLLVSQDMSPVGSGTYRCASFVYRRGVSGWTHEGTLFPPGIDETGSPTWEGCRYFGIGGAISDDGNRVAILSFQRADVFVRTGGGWALEQHLALPVGGDAIGPRYLALSGDGATLLVSDPWIGAGNVYAYSRSGAVWTLAQTIPSPESCGTFCTFGSSLALSPDGVTAAISVGRVIGLPDGAGAVWAFERDATGWHPRRKLTATSPQEFSGFTCSKIVRAGARFICGAGDTVGYNRYQGSLYVVDRAAAGWAAGASSRRAFVGDGFPGDILGAGGSFGWGAFAVSADGTSIDAVIRPENIIHGLYGQDRIGYSFTVPAYPAVASFTPTSGAVGDAVTISGANFIGVSSVAFNGAPATFTVVSPTQITTTVPPGTTTGPITVTAAGGIAAGASAFTFTGSPTFADVPFSNPFYINIERLYAEGITTGCGTNGIGQLIFCPGDNVLRQQMAAFLIRTKGLTQLLSPTPTFADVPTSNPFYGWIERLFEQQITTGCGTNGVGAPIYCPGDNVLRQQMAAFLIRAFR